MPLPAHKPGPGLTRLLRDRVVPTPSDLYSRNVQPVVFYQCRPSFAAIQATSPLLTTHWQHLRQTVTRGARLFHRDAPVNEKVGRDESGIGAFSGSTREVDALRKSFTGAVKEESEEYTGDDALEPDISLQHRQPKTSRNKTYKRRLLRDKADILDLIARKQSPHALQNLLRPSPSLHLELALSEAGDPSLLPRRRPASVHDLSYRDPKTLEIRNVNGFRKPALDQSISLQSITAKFIRHILQARKTKNDIEVSAVAQAYTDFGIDGGSLPLTRDETRFLGHAGYDEGNARTWAELLLTPNIVSAARMLKIVDSSSGLANAKGQSTPWWVMSFLIRREHVTAAALRVILGFVWKALAAYEQARITHSGGSAQPPCPNMMMVLCVRLLRHAKDTWPGAQREITKLFTTYVLDARMQPHTSESKLVGPTALRDLVFKSNRLLSQLSLSGRSYPVLSAAHQQRAQFDLIRKMVKFKLPLNQEGHRALTKVLLLQRKSIQERDWASLQARSWPPFKISRNRLDDAKDRRYGTSTAGRALGFMQGYGYPMRNWDLIAQVYTGWNPDGSPAIQQRAIAPAVPTSVAGEPGVEALHAAIIASTRTIPEAWAAFLKFDRTGSESHAIHSAMFTKLLKHEASHGRRVERLLGASDKDPSLPGDGTEVSPPPVSPLEAVYVPSEPPTVETFFDLLLKREFPIWGRFVLSALEHSPNFEFGLKVWNAAKILQISQDNQVSWHSDHLALLKTHAEQLDTLPDLPQDLLVAMLAWICKFPHVLRDVAQVNRSDLKAGSWRLRADHAHVYAYRLLLYYKPSRARGWNYLLASISRRRSFESAITRQYRTRERFWPLVAWAMASNVLSSMSAANTTPDQTTFSCLCDITMEAAVAAHTNDLVSGKAFLVGAADQTDLHKEIIEVRQLMAHGSSMLRLQFAHLVGLDRDRFTQRCNEQAKPQSHLIIPTAAILHKYVRALGMLGDHEGIYSLAQWMVAAASDLQELQDTQLNGRRHMRQLIVALRVWLESPSRDFVLADRGVTLQPASEELVQLVRNEVEQIKRWGGWPTSENVDRYCSRYPT